MPACLLAYIYVVVDRRPYLIASNGLLLCPPLLFLSPSLDPSKRRKQRPSLPRWPSPSLCLLPSPSAPPPPPPHPFPIQHGVTLSLCLSPCLPLSPLPPSSVRPPGGRACLLARSLACCGPLSFTLDWPQSPHDANTCCPLLPSLPRDRAGELVDGCSRTDGRTLGLSFRSSKQAAPRTTVRPIRSLPTALCLPVYRLGLSGAHASVAKHLVLV